MRAKYIKVNRNKQSPKTQKKKTNKQTNKKKTKQKKKKKPYKTPNRQTLQTCRNIKKTQNNRL